MFTISIMMSIEGAVTMTILKHNEKAQALHSRSGKDRAGAEAVGTQTEKETIERALEEVIEERERNRQAWAAHERFVKSDIEIRDVYGVLQAEAD
ncbi:MAG: hypothetical protein WKF84_16200 [Pyrinomonadaceae bacterium]